MRAAVRVGELDVGRDFEAACARKAKSAGGGSWSWRAWRRGREGEPSLAVEVPPRFRGDRSGVNPSCDIVRLASASWGSTDSSCESGKALVF